MDELGLYPSRLFDTELAGRLLGLPRVGLATLVETLLGYRMAKEHSAVDWSTRPLPAPWLEYAALDVEVLVELRDLLAAELVEAGKDGWAAEEFEALRGLRPDDPDGPVAAYVGLAQGPRAPGPGRRPGALDDPRPDRRRARRDAEPDHPRLGHRGRGAGPADDAGGAEEHQGVLRPRRRPLRRPLGRGADAGARPAREPAPVPAAADRRAASAARLGREGSRRWPTPPAGPRGDHGGFREAPGARREPAHPRLPAPGAVDPARRRASPRSSPRPCRSRCATWAPARGRCG